MADAKIATDMDIGSILSGVRFASQAFGSAGAAEKTQELAESGFISQTRADSVATSITALFNASMSGTNAMTALNGWVVGISNFLDTLGVKDQIIGMMMSVWPELTAMVSSINLEDAKIANQDARTGASRFIYGEDGPDQGNTSGDRPDTGYKGGDALGNLSRDVGLAKSDSANAMASVAFNVVGSIVDLAKFSTITGVGPLGMLKASGIELDTQTSTSDDLHRYFGNTVLSKGAIPDAAGVRTFAGDMKQLGGFLSTQWSSIPSASDQDRTWRGSPSVATPIGPQGPHN